MVIVKTMKWMLLLIEREFKVKGEPRKHVLGSNPYEFNKAS